MSVTVDHINSRTSQCYLIGKYCSSRFPLWYGVEMTTVPCLFLISLLDLSGFYLTSCILRSVIYKTLQTIVPSASLCWVDEHDIKGDRYQSR
jgi:hypothetical protein